MASASKSNGDRSIIPLTTTSPQTEPVRSSLLRLFSVCPPKSPSPAYLRVQELAWASIATSTVSSMATNSMQAQTQAIRSASRAAPHRRRRKRPFRPPRRQPHRHLPVVTELCRPASNVTMEHRTDRPAARPTASSSRTDRRIVTATSARTIFAPAAYAPRPVVGTPSPVRYAAEPAPQRAGPVIASSEAIRLS